MVTHLRDRGPNLTLHPYLAAAADGEVDLIPMAAGFGPDRLRAVDFSSVTNYMEFRAFSRKSDPGQV